MAIVVGKDAAQTPGRWICRSSSSVAITSGGAHAKHADSPGTTSYMCPLMAFSETPLSIHTWSISLQALLMLIRAA